MRKSFILLLLFSTSVSRVKAQYLDLGWVKGIGSSNDESSYSMTTDASGNVYSVGTFRGTADFDPGPGVYNLTGSGSQPHEASGFVSKLDSSGNFLLAKHFDAPFGVVRNLAIAVDPNGNMLITGSFQGWVDFDPGPGTNSHYGYGTDIFLVKLNASGDLEWVKCTVSADFDSALSLSLDPAGNIYLTGRYGGWDIDLDMGPGVFLMPSTFNIYILKLSASGDFIWAKPLGALSGESYSHSIKVTPGGDIFITGQFSGSGDFDPGPGVYTLTCNGGRNSFIVKLTASGDFVWAKQFRPQGSDPVYNSNRAYSVLLDATGNVYIGGYFEGVTDFDPGTGVYNLFQDGLSDAYICKLDNTGNFLWAKKFSGFNSRTTGTELAIDQAGRVYLTGMFTNSIDVDPGSGVNILTSRGSTDIFVILLNAAGNLVAAKAMGGTASDGDQSFYIRSAIATSPSGKVYVSNSFRGTADFNLCQGTSQLTSAGNKDFFAAKLDLKTPSATISTSSTSVLCGTDVTFTANVINGGPAPNYQWSINGVNVGPNAVTFTTSNIQSGDVVKVIVTANCFISSPLRSDSITMTVLPSKTASVSVIADNNKVCSGTPVTFTTTSANGGAAPTYQWQVNGVNAGANSPIFVSSSLVNGDQVRVLISSSDDCADPGPVSSNSVIMEVSSKESPAVSIAPFPADICYGKLVTFIATVQNGGNDPSFEWRLNGALVGSNKPSFVTSDLYDGDELFCIMTSSAACLDKIRDSSDRIIVKVDPLICPIGFYMPTAFTPNGDGKNDHCKPLLFGKVITYSFALYNRWGQKVFATTNLQKGWDGRIGGREQDSNSFVWTCTYQFKDQPLRTEKGTVTLIR